MSLSSSLRDAVQILVEGSDDSPQKIQCILEDVTSPITRTFKEKLFQSVIDRSHIDFGDIPKSKGVIEKYSGYNAMNETLDVLLKIAREEKAKDLEEAVNIVTTAITNIRNLKSIYVKAYANKADIAIMDYQTYTLTCVEATTSLMCSYIDFIKTPSSPVYQLTLKDTKYRANNLYFTQLEKFNRVNKSGEYSKYLATVVNKGTDNFLLNDAMIVGAGAVSAIALAIIPVTRELVYMFKETRRKLSELFALQAYFLEMNKISVEANTQMKDAKKKKVLEKQERLRMKFLFLADKLKVSSIKANETAQKKLDEDNRGMTAGSIEDEVSDSDIDIF